MNEYKIPHYKKFILFKKIQTGIDEEGRIVSYPTNTPVKLEHIHIQEMKCSSKCIFLLGKIIKIPNDDNENEIHFQLGDLFLFKYYNNQLLAQFKIFDKDVQTFDIVTLKDKDYLISLGIDVQEQELGPFTRLKVFDVTECSDPLCNDTEPRYIYNKAMMLTKNEKKLIFEHKNKDNIMLDNVNMITSRNDGKVIALLFPNRILFLINKDKTIWNRKDNDFLTIWLKTEEKLPITSFVLLNNVTTEKGKVECYFSTSNGVYFGVVHIDTSSVRTNKIQNIKELQEKCIIIQSDPKRQEVVVASGNKLLLIQGTNYQREFIFEEQINYLHLFNTYICMSLFKNDTYYLGIFNPKNKVFQHYEQIGNKINFILSHHKSLWYSINGDTPMIIELQQRNAKENFDVMYANGDYDSAINYACSLQYSHKQIFNIHLQYAKYLYDKADYAKSIDQYIQTISDLEPSAVIAQFYDDDKLDYLVQYLEALLYFSGTIFKVKRKQQRAYTALLMSCYIKQKNISKLEDFVDMESEEQDIIVQTALAICKEQQEIKTAEIIANKTKKKEYIIQILLEFKNEFKEALNKIEEGTKAENINLLLQFGAQLIDKEKERTFQMTSNLIRDIIDANESYKTLLLTNKQYKLLAMISKPENKELFRKNKIDNVYESQAENFFSLQTPNEGPIQINNKGREILKATTYPELYKALTNLKEQGEITLENEIMKYPSLFRALNTYPEVLQYIKEYPQCLFELRGYEGKEETMVRLAKENPFLIKLFAYFKGIGSLVMQRKEIIPILKKNCEIFKVIQIHPNITDVIIKYPKIAGLICKYPELGKMVNFYPEISPLLRKHPEIAKLVKDNTKLVKYLIKDPSLVELIKCYPSLDVLNDEMSLKNILSQTNTNDIRNAVKLEYAKKIREDYEICSISPEKLLSLLETQEHSVSIRKIIDSIIFEYKYSSQSLKYAYIEHLLERYSNLSKSGKDNSKEYDETTLESVKNKLLELIDLKNPFLKDIDINYVMSLFQINQFKEGIAKILNQSEINNEMLSLTMAFNLEDNKNEHYDKLIELCMKAENKCTTTDQNKNYWLQTLGYFIEHSNELFQTKNGMKNFQKVISTLVYKHYISPVYLLHLLKKDKQEHPQDMRVPYKAIKDFLLTYITSQKPFLKEEQTQISKRIQQIEQIDNQLHLYQRKSIQTTLNKCVKCKNFLSFPYIYFLCGHSIHTSCYSEEKKLRNDNDNNELSCCVCLKEHKDLLKQVSSFQKEDTLYFKELTRDLKDPSITDKCGVIASYLSKGVFNEELWRNMPNPYA